MKLIISIVQHKDAINLVNVLTRDGVSVTKLASTGGFLRAGNTTLLIGVKEEIVDNVISKVKDICKTREKHQKSGYPIIESTGVYVPYSPEVNVEVGGATIFVVDVDRFVKI